MTERVRNLRKLLKEKGLDGALISDISNIFYFSGIDFFDTSERDGFLLITANKNYVLTSGIYAEAVRKNTKDFVLLENTVNKPMDKNILETFKKYRINKIGFEENNLTVSEYTKFKKLMSLSPASEVIDELRAIKDDLEIRKIKKACNITDMAFEYIVAKLKLGVSEKYIAETLEDFFKKKGVSPSFNPIVAFGSNSSLPHHVPTDTKLKKNQIVLMDFGVKYQGYCSDFTRTVFFGKASQKFKDMYSAVLDSQQAAFELLKRNKDARLSEVDAVARNLITKSGFPTTPHSLGHQIGIDVHDGGPRLGPSTKEKVQNGHVFSIEPGIYIPGVGGIRIEDLVYFKNGPHFITYSNRNLLEI